MPTRKKSGYYKRSVSRKENAELVNRQAHKALNMVANHFKAVADLQKGPRKTIKNIDVWAAKRRHACLNKDDIQLVQLIINKAIPTPKSVEMTIDVPEEIRVRWLE